MMNIMMITIMNVMMVMMIMYCDAGSVDILGDGE